MSLLSGKQLLKPLTISGSLIVTGSLNVSGSVTATSFTGSLLGTASYATYALTASYAYSSSIAISSSFASSSNFATSASYALTASYAMNVVQSNQSRVTSGSTVVQTYASGLVEISGSSDATTKLILSGSLVVGRNTATGLNSHAEGYQTIASGSFSHAEGYSVTAVGESSHAEGLNTLAQGDYSHAEGYLTMASGRFSHAEGIGTLASGNSSHAEGLGTIAQGNYQHVQGQYNATSSVQSAFIVGNGTDDSNRNNLIYAAGTQVEISGSLITRGNQTITGSFTNIGPAIFSGSVISTLGFTGSLRGTASNAIYAENGSETLQEIINNSVVSNVILGAITQYDTLILREQDSENGLYIYGASTDPNKSVWIGTIGNSTTPPSPAIGIDGANYSGVSMRGTPFVPSSNFILGYSGDSTQGAITYISASRITFPYTGNAVITGSLTVSRSSGGFGGITGSLQGTASYALTASYAMNGGNVSTASLLTTASVLLNTITFTKGDGSTFPITVNTGSGGAVSGDYVTTSSFNAFTSSVITTASFNSFTQSYNTGSFTGSFTGNGSGLTNIPTQSINTGSFATTGSNTFRGNQTITGSIIFNSGSQITSTYYGNAYPGYIDIVAGAPDGFVELLSYNQSSSVNVDDYSVYITTRSGSLFNLWEFKRDGRLVASIAGGIEAPSFTGSLQGTASFATSASRAISSSFAVSSSFASTSSYVQNAQSASYVSSNFQYEIHVSQVDGNDTTGNGDLLKPVATIGKALLLVSASVASTDRRTIIVHPGTYIENITINTTNTYFFSTGVLGANCLISGSVTISAAARMSGIKMTNLIVSSSNPIYINNCAVDKQMIVSGSGYLEVQNTSLQCTSGIQVVGPASSGVIFENCSLYPLTVNNASAAVYVISCNQAITPTLTAGALTITRSTISSLTSGATSTALTTAAGSVLVLESCNVYNSLLTSHAAITANGFYSIKNVIYNRSASTLASLSGTGGPLATVSQFQYINADNINSTQGLTVTGSINVSGSVINSLTASYATNALSASYASNGGVTQLLAGPNITLSPTTGVGQVTVSSTSGGGGFNTATGSYGSFYSTQIQTNVAGTARSMSLNTTDITNGVSISGSTNPYNTYIKTENAGVYDIQFSAQVDKTDSGTDEIWIWLRKNGTDINDSATSIQLVGNGAHYVAAWNFFVNAAANDYFQLMWYSPDANVRLHAEPAFGVVPGIPSLIVTANRVDQFLSNTGSFSGSFTGNLIGTATTASYISGSVFTTTNPALSASYALTASYAMNGGGGGGTPGGSPTQIQYNNAGAFGGVDKLTYDGTNLVGTGSFTGSFTGQFNGSITTAATASFATNFTIASTLTLDETLTDFAKVNSTIVGSNNLFQQATGSYTSAHGKYTLYKGANARAGEFVTAWNGTTTTYYDNATTDIGSTSDITFQSSIITSQLQLNAVALSSGWTVKMLVTYL